MVFGSEGRATVAVEHIDLSVVAGEFMCLLGPSGCGKTTLLNLFAGFEEPTEGSIRLDGRVVHGAGPDRGAVFRAHALCPWLTVIMDAPLWKRLQQQPRKER